jgi:hypothetical protein
MRLIPMSNRIILFAALFTLSSCVSVIGQQPKVDQPSREVLFTKFDEIHTLAWPDLMARLDNVAITFQQAPANGVLYLIAYAGPRACVGEAGRLNLRAKTYLVTKRGVASTRVLLMDGGYLDKPVLDVWILPFGPPPDAMPNIDHTLVHARNCTKRARMRRRA